MRTTTLRLHETLDLGIFSLMAKAFAPPLVRTEPPAAAEGVAPVAAAAVAAQPRLGLFQRFDNWCWRMEQRSLERYLAQATDIYDLEARIRDLERGNRGRYY